MSEFAAVASKEIGLIVVTAVVFAFAAWRTDQPPLIAYIATGMFLGPAFLGLVQENEFTRLSSELGLALLLFFIGMEVDLDEVREIAGPVTGIGAATIALLGALGYGLGQLMGFGAMESFVIASAASLSSTAVVVKMLSDRDEIRTLPGKLNIGVLLVQDLAVVVALSLIGTGRLNPSAVAESITRMAAVVFVLAPLGIYFSKNHLSRLFSHFADERHILIIHGLAWLFVFMEASRAAGVSIEIGAFVAGVSIAQLPYSTELKENIRPLTDLFMAVFFVNIGLNVASVGKFLLPALGAGLILMAAKFSIFSLVTERFSFTRHTSVVSAANMSQASEFALVLAGTAAAAGTVGKEFVGFLSLLVVTTVAASSYVISYRQRAVESLKKYGLIGDTEDINAEALHDHALIIGYDRIGREAAEHLKTDMRVAVVENDPSKVEELSRSEYEFFFGDFQHEEIRDATRPEEASVIVSSAARRKMNQQVIEDADGALVFVKADGWKQAGELYDLGAHYVMLEEVMAAEQMVELLEDFKERPEVFRKKSEKYHEKISWGERES
ncbi:MAG: cation:proton antiporter [Candidatus Nanohaloarchaea archaeon]